MLVIPHASNNIVSLFLKPGRIVLAPHPMTVHALFLHHGWCACKDSLGEITLGRRAERVTPLLLFVFFLKCARSNSSGDQCYSPQLG
jgi:hypothetical protein